MKLKEFKDKTIEELEKMYRDLGVKRQELDFKVASRQLKNVREIRELKKNIAQVLTLLTIKKNK